jgi:CDP-L-myo-inositol myo-inositolphosphotransferase
MGGGFEKICTERNHERDDIGMTRHRKALFRIEKLISTNKTEDALTATQYEDLEPGVAVKSCLIIAAGKGSRLQKNGDSKPLTLLLGISIIERIIRSIRDVGIEKFYIVTGYKEKHVKFFLNKLAHRLKISIQIIYNKDWEKENGLSVLKAESYLKTPFFLLMADHLFDTTIIQEMIKTNSLKDNVILCVDNDTNPSSHVDLDDVTKVKTENGNIQEIGKDLKNYNGFDTGIFLCTPIIFKALAQAAKSGQTTLSAAMMLLAQKGKANAFFIKHKFWIDIDKPLALKQAETVLIQELRNKPNDGPVSTYLNRPISTRLSRILLTTPITPTQLTVATFLLSVVATGLFMTGHYLWLIVGAILAQFASIVDGCDGEIARLKFLESRYGKWLDAVLDRYGDAMLLFGLTSYAYINYQLLSIYIIGFFAIIGSFMLSYTADKYDHLMKNRIGQKNRFRLGRDVRIFLIFLGAILNQVVLILTILAVVMNIETCRRIFVCKDNE